MFPELISAIWQEVKELQIRNVELAGGAQGFLLSSNAPSVVSDVVRSHALSILMHSLLTGRMLTCRCYQHHKCRHNHSLKCIPKL